MDVHKLAKQRARKLMRTNPEIFPEWVALQQAKRQLAAELARVKILQARWDDMRGKS